MFEILDRIQKYTSARALEKKAVEKRANEEFVRKHDAREEELAAIGRKNYAEEMARIRNLIAEAIDLRLHFVDVECEIVGYRSFVKIINTIANEPGSYVLDRHFHSSPSDVSFGHSRSTASFASLTLEVAPKNSK